MGIEWIATIATVAFFLGMLACIEAGRRIGIARLTRDADGLEKGAGAAEAALFALLGLLLAFTFSSAASRFETRKHLIVAEANAIGTAYLRLGLLPGDEKPVLRDLFRRYLDVRVATYRNVKDLDAIRARLDEGAALQAEIWTTAMQASQQPGAPSQLPMLLMPALNEMFDITTTRDLGIRSHQPPLVFLLLVALSFLASLLVGYDTSPNRVRSWFHMIVFAGILTLTVYVIVDLEFPRVGLIRVDAADQALVELRQQMR